MESWSEPLRSAAVIFDFDGVILESVGIKTEIFAQLFHHKSDHLPAILDLHHRLGGVCRYRKFDLIYTDILRRPLDEEERARLGHQFETLVSASIDACPFVPGALEFLIEHKGHLPMFVASGTPEAELRAIVERRGLKPYFTGVYGSPSLKTEIIARILAQHHLQAAEVVFVGDSLTDYEAAAATGLSFFGRVAPGVPNPFSPGTRTMPDLCRLQDHLIPKADGLLSRPAGKTGADHEPSGIRNRV